MAHATSASTSKLCAKTTPFDFTACGGYAQGERQKSQQPQGPFMLSVAAAQSKQRRVGCGSYAPIWSRHGSSVRHAHENSGVQGRRAHSARYAECANVMCFDLGSSLSVSALPAG